MVRHSSDCTRDVYDENLEWHQGQTVIYLSVWLFLHEWLPPKISFYGCLLCGWLWWVHIGDVADMDGPWKHNSQHVGIFAEIYDRWISRELHYAEDVAWWHYCHQGARHVKWVLWPFAQSNWTPVQMANIHSEGVNAGALMREIWQSERSRDGVWATGRKRKWNGNVGDNRGSRADVTIGQNMGQKRKLYAWKKGVCQGIRLMKATKTKNGWQLWEREKERDVKTGTSLWHWEGSS